MRKGLDRAFYRQQCVLTIISVLLYGYNTIAQNTKSNEKPVDVEAFNKFAFLGQFC